jgi:hypothetical protein
VDECEREVTVSSVVVGRRAQAEVESGGARHGHVVWWRWIFGFVAQTSLYTVAVLSRSPRYDRIWLTTFSPANKHEPSFLCRSEHDR